MFVDRLLMNTEHFFHGSRGFGIGHHNDMYLLYGVQVTPKGYYYQLLSTFPNWALAHECFRIFASWFNQSHVYSETVH